MLSFIVWWFVLSVVLGTLVGHCISAMNAGEARTRRSRGDRPVHLT